MNRWQFPDPEPRVKSPEKLNISEADEAVVEEGQLKFVASEMEATIADDGETARAADEVDVVQAGSVEYILSWQAMRERLQVPERTLREGKDANVINSFAICFFLWIAVGFCVVWLLLSAFDYGLSSVPGAPIGGEFRAHVKAEFLYLAALCATIWLYLTSVLVRFFSLNAFFPSAVSLGQKGFFFSWFSEKSSVSPVIPWHAVKEVTVRNLPVKKKNQANGCMGTMLVLSIDLHDVDNRRQILRQTSGFSDYSCSGLLGIPESRTEKVQLKLPLAALSREADGYKFLHDLKTRLSECCQNREFRELLDKFSSESFTRLWLDEALSHRRDNTMELVKGQSLQDGRYLIEERIAIGGQATIYRAWMQGNTAFPLGVAIKEFVLPNGGTGSAMGRSLESIRKEASLLASLEHPAIPKLLDNFVEDQRAYLCFEFIEGCSLRSLVQEEGCLSPGLVFDIAEKLADILVYLHGRAPAVVHRDLSPDNLMLSPNGRLSLIDFNVAEQLDSSDTKTVVGKQHYMAPEQFKGRPCPQSDLYSMGCCLYYLLTGREPRPLSPSVLNLEECLAKKPKSSGASGAIDFSSATSALEVVPEPLGDHNTLADWTRLRDLILKLTQLSLNDRYQTSGQVLGELVQKTPE